MAVESAVLGQRVIWGAPTYDQVRICWDETRHGVRNFARFTQHRMTAEFSSGGAIVYRSLDDPDNVRGHTADGAIIDEISKVKPAAWYEVIRPMLIDTGGWAWNVGTPDGRNFFWKEHVAARDREDSATWQVPTLGCRIEDRRLVREPHPLENPHIEWDEILHLFRTMPERVFRQEILAEFVEHEGSVFRNIQACTNAPRDAKPKDHEGHSLVAGIDWGKHMDFTAVCVGCADCRVEVAMDRFNQVDYVFQRGRIKVLHDRWGTVRLMAELNAMGEPNFEALRDDGLPMAGFQTTAASKPPLIENLALALEREEWQFIDDPVWTGELEAYERKVSSTTGRSSYSAPVGMHDDTVMARALMLRCAERAGPVLLGWG